MILKEALDYLKTRGFIIEATTDQPGDCLKYVKGLNGWDIKQQNQYITTDNLYAVKVIAGERVGVDIYIYLKKDEFNEIKIDFSVFKLGDSFSNIKLKHTKYIKSVAKELKKTVSSYLDKVEEVITYIVTNKIRVPKGNLDSILDFNKFKERYDSKKDPVNKKIYDVCKRYASTTSDIDYVDAYHYPDYNEKDKGKNEKVYLGCKGYSFEIRRAQRDGLSRFRRMQDSGKFVMVVPERGEVWFNYWTGNSLFSRGPEKFSTPEELAKILIAA